MYTYMEKKQARMSIKLYDLCHALGPLAQLVPRPVEIHIGRMLLPRLASPEAQGAAFGKIAIWGCKQKAVKGQMFLYA